MQQENLSKLRIDEAERGPAVRRKRRRRLIWLILLSLAVGLTLGLLGWSGMLTPPVEVRPVTASKMYASQALTVLNASGYVVAQRKAAVSSKATGRLAHLFVEEGKRVKKGEIIASLENEDLRAILEQAEAGLKVSKAHLKNAQAELTDATRQFNRQKYLKETGAVSEQAFDSAEARYRKAIATERSASFGIEQARAAVLVAQVNLDYSFIRAPFDGVILTKNADEGEVVAPFGGALNAKAAVVTMADMSSLLVEVDVSESSLQKVKPGGACEIRLDAFPQDRFEGKVHMIVPTADRSKATVLTKVKFLNIDEKVLPEMSAKVAFLSRPLKEDEKEPFLGIPVSAVRNSPGDKHVFVIRGREAILTPVKTGRQWGEVVEILSGLKEGDEIVSNPGEGLSDHSTISVMQ
ncbi:MAG: efflux RND transporter periplasmic adaptor subunit [Deltaproteobacteria bacterium]